MTGIKGNSVKIKGPVPVTATFSNEDLSVAFDYDECSVDELLKVLKDMELSEAITPDVIKNLKKEKLFVQALESSADRLSKFLEVEKTGKNISFRVEYHDNGVIKIYFDNKMVEKSRLNNLKESLLVPLRNSVLGLSR